MTAPIVSDNTDLERYEISLDDRVVGICDYQRRDGVVLFPHVEVEPAFRGRGLAGQLVTAALDATRAAGQRAVPQCPYVVAFVRKHPEYQDLVAAE